VPRAAPRPVRCAVDEAGPDRVVQDVFDGGPEVLLVPDHPAAEAVAEEVAVPAVARVELERMDAV